MESTDLRTGVLTGERNKNQHRPAQPRTRAARGGGGGGDVKARKITTVVHADGKSTMASSSLLLERSATKSQVGNKFKRGRHPGGTPATNAALMINYGP